MRRREFLTMAAVGGAVAGVGGPVFLRRAYAQTPIKIGMPAALSGSNAQYGIQARRAGELFAKDIKAKGILGRPVEFIYEDTGGDPATAVRKAQKLVEKDGVKFLTGVALSSEALAVSAKCPEWKVVFMSTINGAGSLTTKSFHRYFFRVNTSGPMGARAVSLYLAESPMKRFFGLGSDYAWGRDSVGSFSEQITAAKKEVVGKDYPPVGTKDFASYIAKIRQSKAEGVYLVLAGQDATIFPPAGPPVRLDARGEADHGDPGAGEHEGRGRRHAGGDRQLALSLHRRHAEEPRLRRPLSRDARHLPGHVRRRDVRRASEWLAQVIQKAGTADDVEKVIDAWEDSSYEGLEGPFFMRKCDHQAVQPGFMVEAVKDPKYPHLIPKILATYPGDKVTPKCRTEEFS